MQKEEGREDGGGVGMGKRKSEKRGKLRKIYRELEKSGRGIYWKLLIVRDSNKAHLH